MAHEDCKPELALEGLPAALLNNSSDVNIDKNNSDDTSTILNLSEYKPQIWMNILSYGVPTVGIALLLLTHPLLCIASLGLVGMGGGMYATIDGDCMGVLGQGKPSSEAAQVDDSTIPMPLEEEEGEQEKMGGDKESQRDIPLTITSLKSSDDEPTLCLTDEDSAEQDRTPIPSKLQNAVLDAKFPGLHAKEFFEVFFGDKAPFSFRDFQERRGDINISYGPWEQRGESKQRQRTLKFATPTRNPLFGPPHAPATKIQFQRTRETYRVIMESTTTLQDIPYADRFCVKELWILQSSPEDKTVELSVSSEAIFFRSCPFESQIRTKSLATLRETLSAWAVVAKHALRVTQRQREREARRSSVPTRRESEDVEVTYHRRRLSCVLGEEEDEDDDWELDPMTEASVSSTSTARRKSPLQALRNSVRRRFARSSIAVKER